MGKGMEALRRDFLVPDLEEAARTVGITATIAVQARQSIEETEWLSEVASQTALIRGVVGWAPLVDREIQSCLERISDLPKIVGIRHVLHDESDPFYLLRKDFNHGVSLLNQYDLRYDLLIFESHLPQTIRFVDLHPNQIFVVDHIAKPRIRERVLYPWKEKLAELASRENVYCKMSGLVTQASWESWQDDDLMPYLEAVLEVFGPSRTMFGSDWPVLTLASSYERWARTVCKTITTLTES
jgi:L-fuconolactonase